MGGSEWHYFLLYRGHPQQGATIIDLYDSVLTADGLRIGECLKEVPQ